MADENPQSGSVGTAAIGTVVKLLDVFSLVTKPITATGSFIGTQWANHLSEGGIPKTSRMVMDAMKERMVEVGMKEVQRIQSDPIMMEKMQNSGFVKDLGTELAKGMAQDGIMTSILAKEPTVGVALSIGKSGYDSYASQKEFYRDFVKIAGSVNPQTARPNIAGFASVPFVFKEEGKESKEYRVLVDAGHTLGDFIAEEGHQNRPVFLIVDENGDTVPSKVLKSLENNETFRTEVLEPAMYDAYTDMKDQFGVNMVDGKLDDDEYKQYIKSVLRDSPLMDEIALKAAKENITKIFPSLYEGEIPERFEGLNKPVISVAPLPPDYTPPASTPFKR